jgi:hypothetical protein
MAGVAQQPAPSGEVPKCSAREQRFVPPPVGRARPHTARVSARRHCVWLLTVASVPAIVLLALSAPA